MMKKQWTLPRILVQEFEANEYVAVCWGVACDCNAANNVEWRFMPDGLTEPNVSHDYSHCGLSTNQVVRDTNGDGHGDQMVEINTEITSGDLPCTIYTSQDYKTTMDVSQVTSNSYIYWTTSASDGRVWHHQGWVTDNFPGHPNRS